MADMRSPRVKTYIFELLLVLKANFVLIDPSVISPSKLFASLLVVCQLWSHMNFVSALKGFFEHRHYHTFEFLATILEYHSPNFEFLTRALKSQTPFHSCSISGLGKVQNNFEICTSLYSDFQKLFVQWYAGIRPPPPYWCRNKTISERPIIPSREKFWLFLAFEATFRRSYLWNLLLKSNVVRVYCNYIDKVILCYFTFIFDLLMTLEKGKNAGIRPLFWQNRRQRGVLFRRIAVLVLFRALLWMICAIWASWVFSSFSCFDKICIKYEFLAIFSSYKTIFWNWKEFEKNRLSFKKILNLLHWLISFVECIFEALVLFLHSEKVGILNFIVLVRLVKFHKLHHFFVGTLSSTDRLPL